MDRRDARLALDLARQWTREGLMPAASLASLEARHAQDAQEDPDAESFGASVLYALGGVLLAAAAFALLVLLQDNRIIDRIDVVAPWLLLAWGAACLGIALAIDLVARRPALGDAFHVAALVALTAAAFPRPHDLPLGHVAMLAAAGILAYRRRRFMVPFLAIGAFNIAWAPVMDSGFWPLRNDVAAFSAWLALVLLQVVAVVLARSRPWPWPSFSLAGLTLLLAGAVLAWYFEVVEDIWRFVGFEGDFELLLALVMGAMLAWGLRLREKGMVLAAALAIAIDSIVFAFDVGEIVGGLIAILAVAGLLIWQAGALRRYLREG